MLPDEVLNCTLPGLQAVVDGYQDHMFDLQCIAVNAGFWAGYYSSSKHPKPVKAILEKMYQLKTKARQQSSGIAKPKPDVDVETFLAQERRFKERSEHRARQY